MTGEKPGQFVVSIDLEMSWGAVHHGRPHDDRPYRREREVVHDVLAAMEEHRISATWAIVGHLFLDRCSPVDGRKHPEIVRPDYEWLEGDWYDLDPASSRDEAPTWYGPDLVAAIRSCSVPQEIGSHAFGHIIAGDPQCSEAAFVSDLSACHDVAAAFGIELKSFVYPRNSLGHLDALEGAGFRAFRGSPPPPFAGLPSWQRKLMTTVDHIRPTAATAVHPSRHGTMANVPHTYMFNPDSQTARRWGTQVWIAMAQRRLRHAVRTSSMFHLWFHSHNLADRPERARAGMDALFGRARALIDAGDLENLTMGEIADRMSAPT